MVEECKYSRFSAPRKRTELIHNKLDYMSLYFSSIIPILTGTYYFFCYQHVDSCYCCCCHHSSSGAFWKLGCGSMDMFLQLTIYVAFDILPLFSFVVTYLSLGQDAQLGAAVVAASVSLAAGSCAHVLLFYLAMWLMDLFTKGKAFVEATKGVARLQPCEYPGAKGCFQKTVACKSKRGAFEATSHGIHSKYGAFWYALMGKTSTIGVKWVSQHLSLVHGTAGSSLQNFQWAGGFGDRPLAFDWGPRNHFWQLFWMSHRSFPSKRDVQQLPGWVYII